MLATLSTGASLAGCGSRDPAPQFSYTLLDGRKASSAELRGKVLLLNFWATSCVTCVAEMPKIIATHNKFQARAYDTLAVAMRYDPPAYVASFAETRQLPFGVVIDNTGAIAKGFGDVQLTPTTFLLDKKGGIVKRYVGEPDFAALHQLIEQLIAEA
ncbi:MAG: TlpA disulfide reductase family protein [Rubrivivax sp.]